MGKAPFLTLLSSAISANPYLVIKGHNSIFDQDKSLNSENIIKLAYDRKVCFNYIICPTILNYKYAGYNNIRYGRDNTYKLDITTV